MGIFVSFLITVYTEHPFETVCLKENKMIKQTIKYGIYISCLILFIYFSCLTLIGFIKGEVVYNVVNENDVKPGFPSITLCPYFKRKIVNLKTDQIQSDFKLNETETDGINMIYRVSLLNNISLLLKNYSFSVNETFFGSSVM